MARAMGCMLLGVSGWLALCALGGCNEVLDIEQATLDSGGSTGSAGAGAATGSGDVTLQIFNAQCQPKTFPDACTACLKDNCGDLNISLCLADKSCRVALGQYSTCLGPTCNSKQGECLDGQLITPTQQFALECVGKCSSECSGTPFLSTCQLYCGCMVSNCTTRVPPSDQAHYADLKTCVAYCEGLDPTLVNCRWSHCERAPDDLKFNHCEHADGIGQCASVDMSPAPADCTTKTKSKPGFYCDKPEDCCTNKCNTTAETCLHL